MGVLKAVLYAWSASSSFRDQSLMLELTVVFKNFIYLPIGNFSLPICLRVISQAHNVFDTISAHEFVKHLI